MLELRSTALCSPADRESVLLNVIIYFSFFVTIIEQC